MQLFLFTDSFPYAYAEPFLESELPFLAEKFDTVHIIPLFGGGRQREVPGNANVWQPILNFNPRSRRKLLTGGLLNLSPCPFAVTEFFKKKIYADRHRLWNFFTALLLYRAVSASKKMLPELKNRLTVGDRIYFYWGNKTALTVPLLKKKHRNMVSVRLHGTDLYEEANNGYIPFRETLFSAVDSLLPISNNGRDYLKSRYGINENKIRVSRLGVFDRGDNPLSAGNQPFHLVSCSNMIPVKRLHLIVEALKLTDVRVIWTHIGAGTLSSKIMESAANFPDNIQTHFTGQLSNGQVIEFYQNNPVDLFINVSASEGIPVSVMEALSFGIPVVATDVGGVSELVDDTVGRLLPATVSAPEIAAMIRQFAESDLNSLRKNAKKRWAERCDARKNYREFSKFISQPFIT